MAIYRETKAFSAGDELKRLFSAGDELKRLAFSMSSVCKGELVENACSLYTLHLIAFSA